MTVGIVQARFGSSRLPGKAMQRIGGRPMLWHVLSRARAIKGLDCVVLATGRDERNRALCDLAASMRIWWVAGDDDDVLGRFAQVARLTQAQVVMRLTGDCPLLAPDVCDRVLAEYRAHAPCFATNDVRVSGYPDGTDCEVFPAAALLEADRLLPRLARWVHDAREHVTPEIRRRLPKWIVASDQGDWRHEKLSVDTAADLERVRHIYRHLQPASSQTLTATLAALVEARSS